MNKELFRFETFDLIRFHQRKRANNSLVPISICRQSRMTWMLSVMGAQI